MAVPGITWELPETIFVLSYPEAAELEEGPSLCQEHLDAAEKMKSFSLKKKLDSLVTMLLFILGESWIKRLITLPCLYGKYEQRCELKSDD